jgi:CheY-like chemotaxis protein
LARKILLADDSVTAQNMGRRILSDAGYDVTTVNNGSAALKKIAESKPDLIVLDVYMPGYGGLEVCQRLREAPETARIPVLLTVGKLEPFKAEEARRVRADAFIVKPFEASELLTALTKLEDKIVPQSQPSKQSRFAKALAGVDDFTPGKEFGDSETGWKNRLSIPPPHSKPREYVPEEPPTAVASSPARTEEPKPAEMKSGLEEDLLSSLPQDVTAEEIAAIKAAAAAFSAPSDESTFRPQPARDQAEAPTQGPVAKAEELPSESAVSAENISAENRGGAAAFAAASQRQAETVPENISAVAQAESSATPGETTTAEPVSSVDVPAETAPPPAMMVSESPASTAPQVVNAETGKLADDEVTAALASLAPANGHGDATAIDRESARWDFASRDQVPVTMAIAGATQEFSGPRWIAEPVPVMDDEATLVLEQEMEKAYAALAADDAVRMSFTSSPAEPYASLGVAEATAANSETASSAVETFSNSDSSESKPPESMSPTAATSSEESAAPEADPSPVADFPIVDVVSPSPVSEVTESAAYAAAASASPSTADGTMDAEAMSQPSPVVESSENVASVPEPSGRHGESELAAAWANWKQIRESVIGSQLSGSQLSGSQLSSQIADTVAELKESSSEAQPESQPDASPATVEETSEIANIVDSVLADLKPKLMAEIARKMAKDPKRK